MLRSLLDAFNEAKKTAGLTIVRILVSGLVIALLAGAFVKLKVFGGGQRVVNLLGSSKTLAPAMISQAWQGRGRFRVVPSVGKVR